MSTFICSAPYVRHRIYVSTLFPRAKPRSHFCRGTKLISSKSPRGSGNAPWIPLLKLQLKPGKKHKRSHGATFWGTPYGWRGWSLVARGVSKRFGGVVWWRWPWFSGRPQKIHPKMVQKSVTQLKLDLGFKNWAWKIWRIFLVLSKPNIWFDFYLPWN